MAGDSGRDLVSRLVMCVLFLGFVLPTPDSGSPPTPEGTSYEVIIPSHLVQRTSEGKNYETSYIIRVAGTDYIVRLKHRENLLVKDLPVFTYDSKGRRIKSHPYVPVDCYCEGYVEGVLNSWVALSTCSGLRGFLKIGDVNYGIEPLQGSSTFQHFLYPIKETDPDAFICSMGSEGTGPRMEDLVVRQDVVPGRSHPGKPMYIELFIVVDNVMFQREAGNESKVLDTVLNIVNMVNTYYSYLQVHVAPCGLEIWTQGNPITVSDNITEVLENFNAWRIKNIEPAIKYDTAHLFVYKRFGREPGKAYPDAICKPQFSAGVDSHTTPNNYLFSKVVAHVLGHSLGLKRDGPHCVCDRERSCIMHLFHSQGTLFSNCSVEAYVAILESGRLSCLINVPNFNKVHASNRCGDSVVDLGEECDCGDVLQCKWDPCCNPDCTFKEGVLCNTGPCCYKCKFFAIGKLCRGKVAECDLPEYCNGESEWCPEDVYMQDGTPCNKTAYCYAKNCLTHNSLCATIFGEGARGAPRSCFQEVNTAGNLFGNCGGDGKGGQFVKCEEKDSMCGRANCVGVKDLPKKWNLAEFSTTSVKGVECWSIGFPHRMGGDDIGTIPNGTHCGAEKICLNRHCISLSSLNLKQACDAEKKCHSRGVCNNLNNCHCDVGWAPPNCKYFGPGGSIDGGFPLQAWNTELMKLAFGIVIPAGLVLMAALTGFLSRLSSWIRHRR
ncbi:disintegrin and metalloproteinase domain-containing protein 9-like [Tiliqua scincoides]|uniref:disintegrin and metalloproteinase domain-containing protein 9-like n=1 Tax=Tiliqua scincoides TaxID=71010 RepID=UPI003461FDAF